ncbi:glycosyltransferase family 2 protein [Nodularia spumigena CS-591/04]|uniref:glycosyltransferase n=1 Tax=Nodularia spumigena TaxID=70799 RepID=UPI00232EB02A|nr:glycosyltransferase family 2 protein [Nodularia spumigena]MDB9322328.1 glycosyltransferase family 2 protein [Nodularia spumigena CS-591/07A]MDB9330889.1 glycosyltransferase family 2 protein [Nodularia spumigena CS-591/04]
MNEVIKDFIMFLIIVFSIINLSIFIMQLQYAIKEIAQLKYSNNFIDFKDKKISVIIPAYNEENNIYDCITSVLNSTSLSTNNLEVVVVDDQSTDNTWYVLENLQQNLNDSRLKTISGLVRPSTEVWVGKNWACFQGYKQAFGNFILFIDADVRLKSKTIETVVQTAILKDIDLLNCIPTVICGSLVEWLVQPLMFINLLISFNSKNVKNPHTEIAYAGGFFMLFRRSAYEQIGGHEAVANQVAEDVALARRIKKNGLKLSYSLGANLASLRMYSSWGALWEGWTKILYVGANRNLSLMLLLALVMISMYTIPWLWLIFLFSKSFFITLQKFDLIMIALALIGIVLQYKLRILALKAFHSSPKYWWLHGLGGILIAVFAIVSVIKAETGWGWTWRGRSLAQANSLKALIRACLFLKN